jgi:hypothetical protein
MCVRRSGLLAALIAVLFVSGCAGSQAGSSPVAPGPSSSSSSSAPAAGDETLSGTVEAGVEPGCLVLKGTGKDHLLLFEPQSLKAQAKVGAAITVVGEAKPTQLTTCQQGIPFIVSSVRSGG